MKTICPFQLWYHFSFSTPHLHPPVKYKTSIISALTRKRGRRSLGFKYVEGDVYSILFHLCCYKYSINSEHINRHVLLPGSLMIKELTHLPSVDISFKTASAFLQCLCVLERAICPAGLCFMKAAIPFMKWLPCD